MQSTVESLGQLQRRVHVSVPVAEVESEIQKRLGRLARTAKIAGFRPGKVPLKMIAKQYGPQVRLEVLNDAVNDSFSKVIQDENLRVAGYPRIEPREGSEDASRFEYTATFEVYPEVVIGDLAGVRVERPVAEVTPADVARTIEILRDQRVVWEAVSRGAARGDRAIVDFTGTIDGIEFAGGQAKEMPIIVGEGRMLPEFEAALAGVQAGENKAFELTFPQDYHGKEVAGKTAVFTMNVKSVSAPQRPEIDADFARAYGIADGGVDKLRSEIEANLKMELKRRLHARVRDQVMEALRTVTPVVVPQSLVEAELQRQLQAAAGELKARGIEPTTENLRPELLRPLAQDRVSLGLIVGELVRQHHLDATADQVRALVVEAAQSYEQPDEVVKWQYQDPDRLGEFEARALEQNIIDWALARCQVVELPMSFAELTGAPGSAGAAS